MCAPRSDHRSGDGRACIGVGSRERIAVGTYNGIAGKYKPSQAAVDQAKSRDWILVAPGDYHEQADHRPKPGPQPRMSRQVSSITGADWCWVVMNNYVHDVDMPPLPTSELAGMPNPCADVPKNPWCP